MPRSVIRASAAVIAASLASPALATWSIILIDTRTGEVALGSATCLTGFDLRANTPVLIPGIGGATAQSFVDSTGQNRVFIRDKLALGIAPSTIITQLATFDTGHQTRQYGIGDSFGRVTTFSGTGAGAWAGGQIGTFVNSQSGRVGAIAYAIQGNVLTGSPVVEQAVQAAIATPGDLPAKLMASMQAARLMGGDGRCSCSAGNPTGCGAPPLNFTKSAHIAYMLIARTGDTEGCNGIYRAGSGPQSLIASDLTGDQRPELLVANFNSSISIITNLSGSVAPHLAPVFTPTPTNYSAGTGVRNLILADITGDQVRDLLTANSGSNTITFLRGNVGGSFSPGNAFGVGAGPRQVVAADFDGENGLDLATANFTANTLSVLLNDGASSFNPAPAPAADAGPVDLAAADIIGSPAIDLIVLSRTANHLTILRGNGDGTFTAEPFLTTANGPTALIAADLDADNDIDLAISTDGAFNLQVFRNDGAGVFTPSTLVMSYQPADLTSGDINGDSKPDIVVGGFARFTTFLNSGGVGTAAFTLDRNYIVPSNILGVTLADLDSDGDLDVSATSSSANGVVTIKNLGPGPLLGRFNDGLGCATGDYFMNFNIANAQAADPDPVIQLQGLYDQWRNTLTAHADAVQSAAAITPPYVPANGSATATLDITLRDWRKELVTTQATIAVTHAPDSPLGPSGVSISPVQSLGNGAYRLTLTAGQATGLDRLRIRVDDGLRPVYLMPEPTLSIYAGTCYPNCDASTVEPILTANDFMCFLQKFVAREPYANCDGSPAFTANDFQCYIQQFANGCP